MALMSIHDMFSFTNKKTDLESDNLEKLSHLNTRCGSSKEPSYRGDSSLRTNYVT